MIDNLDRARLLPRCEWVWTRSDRRQQVWIWPEASGSVEIDLSDLAEVDLDFQPLPAPRVTPTHPDEVALAALLVTCQK